ncbi:MAG TPA: helix-turn-helix domain-containing protein [Gammaproteobacteria bacterium]|jgi:AcrR family transcriptional regulator
MTTGTAQDKRVERTRQALFGAFYEVALSRPYDEVTVDEISARAGVGRSTFYEHFKGKDELLAESVRAPFAILADAMRERDNTAQLVMLLDHFWENRAIAPSMFKGAARAVMVQALVDLIEERFKEDRVGSPNPLIVPPRMAAMQIAESLLAPVTAWILGGVDCSKPALAQALRQTATATLAALRSRSLA